MVLGTIGLIFYIFPFLGIIFVPLMILYQIVATFYRRSSVETKRLDSLMRSALYSSYSGKESTVWNVSTSWNSDLETLTGLSTIRAYREQVWRFAEVLGGPTHVQFRVVLLQTLRMDWIWRIERIIWQFPSNNGYLLDLICLGTYWSLESAYLLLGCEARSVRRR